MIFCGQCGLQLPPGTARCPRCGALADPSMGVGGEVQADAPTVASPSLLAPHGPGSGTQQPMRPFTPVPQQRLVLRPENENYDYGTQQGAYGAASRINNYATRSPSQPGYGTQSGGNYATQNAAFPQYQQAGVAGGSSRGRIAGLALILLGLLLILSAVVMYILHHSSHGSSAHISTSSSHVVVYERGQANTHQFSTADGTVHFAIAVKMATSVLGD